MLRTYPTKIRSCLIIFGRLLSDTVSDLFGKGELISVLPCQINLIYSGKQLAKQLFYYFRP